MDSGTNKWHQNSCKYGVYSEQEIQPNIYYDQADSCP